MSKYDKEREAMGLAPLASSSLTMKKSKYDEERAMYRRTDENKQYADMMKAAYESNPESFAPQQPTESNESGPPAIIAPYVKTMDWFNNTGVGKALNVFAHGAGKTMGVPDEMMNELTPTGNKYVDKAADFIGGAAGYAVNPAMPVGNLGVGQFFEHPAISQVAQRAGNKVQGLLPDAGMTLSRDGSQIVDSLAGKTVNKAVQGAVQGGVGAAAFSPFHTLESGGDVQDIPANMVEEGLYGAGFGGFIGAASPSVQKAFQTLFQRNRSVPTDGAPSYFNDAAQGRNVEQARGGIPNTAQQAADRYGFIDQRTNTDTLALPPSNREVRMNAAQQRGINPAGTDAIPAQGDVHTFALPEPNVVPPTSARAGQNPWRQKFENLVNIANRMEHPPGRELESMEDLWSRMAGPDDPSLYELIERAYPRSKVKPDSLQKARQQQYSREVAGVTGPVKSMADRYEGGVKGEAAAAPIQRERVLPRQSEPAVEVVQPQRKFAPAEATQQVKPAGKKHRGGKLVTAKEFQASKADPSSPSEPAFVKIEEPSAAVPDGAQAYAGNAIPFRQAATQSDRTINRNRVVKNIRKNIGVVIDSGRLRAGRGVLGLYKVDPEVVRTRMAEDLQVISHEVGHHLDKKFDLQDLKFNQEYAALIRHNPVLNVSAYQPHQLPGEGVAEYVRLRLTDPGAARRLAPNFTRYFDRKIDKKTLQGLEASQRDIDTWITQGEYEQAKGLVDFDSGSKKEPFSRDKAYTRFVDDLNPLKLAEKALKGFVGKGSESLYKMARLSRGIAERAKLAVIRGIYDSKGNKVGEGLRQIVQPLENLGIKEGDFATYLAVKHAQDLKAMGKHVPFDDAQINAVLRRLDTPEVRAVQQKIIEYNNHLLDILVDAQILTNQAVADMRKKYPNYVPFFRYFDDDAEAGFKNGGFGAAKGFANITNPLKRMSEEGSTRTIINPIESMVKNTFLVMNAAAKNKVGLQLAELAKVEGAGKWVEHVGPGGSVRNEHIISVWQNGQKQMYKVRDPELYNAMLSLDTESSAGMIKFLGGIASILRSGATLTPEFTVRNMMRDVVSAMINSTKYGFNPLDFFQGLYHVVGKTKTFDQFLSSGGAMSTMMSLDREANREALEAVFRKSLKDKTLNVVTSRKEFVKLLGSPIRGLRKAAEISELSTKVGAFNKTLKKTGDLEEAAYTARDLMDFNRSGSNIRQWNKATAFLNASIQGTDRMARAFKDNPASFMIRAFTTLVLPSIGLHYWINNLPEEQKKVYNNIPQWQKDNFFIVPIPGTDQFARIPKPFEAGMLFATGTERALRWLADNDPEAYKNYGSTLLETFTPPVMISALTPLLEALTNHSFFRDAPIVPQGEQRLEKKDQYGLYTSETAKAMGNAISHIPGLDDSNAASPRIIDNTIKGYTAGLGQYGVAALDELLKAMLGDREVPQPEKAWYERQPVSSFLATTSGGGQVRQDFYDKWDDISKEKASADKNQTPFKNPDYIRMKNAKSVIDKLMQQYKRIQADTNMSSQVKRSKLNDLDDKMNEIAARGLGK